MAIPKLDAAAIGWPITRLGVSAVTRTLVAARAARDGNQ